MIGKIRKRTDLVLQVFWKIVPWILLGLILAMVLALLGFYELPRKMELACPALQILPDGSSRVVSVQLSGTWKPVWLQQTQRQFEGNLHAQEVVDNLPLQMHLVADGQNEQLLYDGCFTEGKTVRLWMDTAMEQGIVLVTDSQTDTWFWLVLQATDMEQANALRTAWELPEAEFGW